MISAAANASIERLLEESIRNNGAPQNGAQCQMAWVEDGADANRAGKRNHLVTLSLSTYLFRLVLFFGFDADDASSRRTAKPNPSEPPVRQELLDVVAEMANLICGEINRGLSQRFPHAGLSTPIVLDGACADYIRLLTPTKVWCAQVTANGAMRYALTACLCINAGTELDFDLASQDAEAAAAGELELF